MNHYRYQAVNQQGKQESGVLQAESEKALRQALRSQQLIPLSVRKVEPTKTQTPFWKRSKVSHKSITLMTRQLATLIEAEIPLAEALHGVEQQTQASDLKHILQDIKNRVSEGYALSVALRAYEDIFSPVYCASVAAGESSGDLSLILNSLADYMEDQQRIRQKVTQAMIYPSFVMIIALVFTAVLLVTVVPQMLEVFADQQEALPTVTKVLLFISDGVKLLGLPVLVLGIVGMIAFKRACREAAFKARWHKLCLRLPLLGHLIMTVQTSRFMRTTALLAQAGVPLLDAMAAGTQVLTSLPMADALMQAKQQVREGVSFPQSLASTHYFSAMSLHMLASGERAGKVEQMMQRAAKQQEGEVEAVIAQSLSLFEPVMILMMGSVVLFIVLAVLLPVFSATQLF